jgi:hypothetical protein
MQWAADAADRHKICKVQYIWQALSLTSQFCAILIVMFCRARSTTAQLTLLSSTWLPTQSGLFLYKPTHGAPRDNSEPMVHSCKQVETTMDSPRYSPRLQNIKSNLIRCCCIDSSSSLPWVVQDVDPDQSTLIFLSNSCGIHVRDVLVPAAD